MVELSSDPERLKKSLKPFISFTPLLELGWELGIASLNFILDKSQSLLYCAPVRHAVMHGTCVDVYVPSAYSVV